MDTCERTRLGRRGRFLAALVPAAAMLVPAAALLPAAAVALVLSAQLDRDEWTVPRTQAGRPDLQGNWTNATLTPIQREEGREPTFTPEEAAAIEGRVLAAVQADYEDSDPNREAPPVGGVFTGDPRFDAASGGTGGYNTFYIDPGERVAVFDGERRASLIVEPSNGRMPPLTDEGRRRLGERRRRASQFGVYDNPENRPLAERCIMSFGSNAGPPMLPNYFYNNNYTIVQTPDHVMIMTEMVHDVRVVRMGEPKPLPAHVRPWMGDSWGRWEGDTLVVETTNIHPQQTLLGIPPSEATTVTERFVRAAEDVIHYEFTVEDPVIFTQEWRGQLPFNRLDGLVYEYACHEGNYALENVLRGARAQERSGNR